MALPGALLYELTDEGIQPVAWQQTQHYQITRRFLEAPERMLAYLLDEQHAE